MVEGSFNDSSGHVVVVGAGNAAICAALAARESGAQVTVLEAAPQAECGGNSAFAGGATRFAFSNLEEIREVIDLTQEEAENTDFGSYTEADFLEDMGRTTQYRCDPDLTELFVCNSRATLAWMKSKGVRFAPIIAYIRPEPTGLGATAPRIKHRHRRVIRVELVRRHHIARQRLDERIEQPETAGDPFGHRGAFQLHAFTRVDLRLAIQRQVIGVL
jgi:aspartate oxidase